LVEDWKSKKPSEVEFITVYISEAHPTDEWHLFKEVDYAQPKTLEERVELTKGYVECTSIRGKVVTDVIEDEAEKMFSAWPERLYVVLDGRVLYAGGKGPFGYRIDHLQSFLEDYFEKVV